MDLPPSAIAERFDIELQTGSGGMGTVYRARDLHTGETVALKVLHGGGIEAVERFQREAQVLAELRHPGIVRYVAHGVSSVGQRYIAMEWLEGESLGERLTRQGLTVPESLTLIHRVAEALSVAHERGIVHRDLKPNNLFLSGGSLEHVKILDFGIAKQQTGARELTMTGAMLGTPMYMSPEQARGEARVDTRADVFSLGCVLFKCITGSAPFNGDDVLSILLKVVMDEAPRASELNDEVPKELDELIARMLAKSPDARPRDAAAVLSELAALGRVPAGREAPVSKVPRSLTTVERHMLCMVLAQTWHEQSDAEVTMPRAKSNARANALRGTLERHSAKLDFLADGTMLVTLTAAGTPIDLAVRAAHCALAVKALWPETPVALVAGREALSARTPMTDLIERGVALLAKTSASAGIGLDEVTAALLGARFDVSETEAGLLLRGERGMDEATRTLLGKPTACEGREPELVALTAAYEACVAEHAARAVLVTAPAGTGKSRLRHELLYRLRQREEQMEVWLGQGDPMSAGAPFSMVASALRPTLGLMKGEPLEVRRRKLYARLSPRFSGAELGRVAEFLGEMIGTPFPGDQSVQLRAARQDPVLMGDQMSRAWEDFLAAECSVQPVVLVLEDLHWGDLPSVRLIDTVLRNLPDQPLFVIALARPEVRDVFPGLWASRDVQEIRLHGLPKRASERLVRQVLGEHADAAVMAQIVERAGGNAFYLEELIRAVAEGRSDALPETVLAMVQSRLLGLEPEARRVLRAASVFGQVFWAGGVGALLGGAERTAQISEQLRTLAMHELITRRGSGRLVGEEEFAFRHGIVREAAYAMLTDEDRVLGHRLAGDWLERAGEHQAIVLAEHFERGAAPERAAHYYLRAAEQAQEGNDLEAAIARASRGASCGASGELLGELRLLMAEAHSWRGEISDAKRCGEEAMELLVPGGPRWILAAAETAVASARLGDYESLVAISAEIGQLASGEEVSGPQAIAAARVAIQLLFSGRREWADALLQEIDRGAGAEASRDPAVAAWIHQAHAWDALFAGDPAEYLALCEAATARFKAAGDERGASTARMNTGYAAMLLGAYEQATRSLREAHAMSARMGLSTAGAEHNLGLVLALQGKWEEARQAERAALTALSTQSDRRMEGGARIYMAQILALEGDLEGAEAEVELALQITAGATPMHALARGTAASIKLRRGRVEEAFRHADEAMELLEALGAIDEGDAFIRLVHAEICWASGAAMTARAAIKAARARLLARAAKIQDPAWRESFLTKVPENARTLELAEAWGCEPDDTVAP